MKFPARKKPRSLCAREINDFAAKVLKWNAALLIQIINRCDFYIPFFRLSCFIISATTHIPAADSQHLFRLAFDSNLVDLRMVLHRSWTPVIKKFCAGFGGIVHEEMPIGTKICDQTVEKKGLLLSSVESWQEEKDAMDEGSDIKKVIMFKAQVKHDSRTKHVNDEILISRGIASPCNGSLSASMSALSLN